MKKFLTVASAILLFTSAFLLAFAPSEASAAAKLRTVSKVAFFNTGGNMPGSFTMSLNYQENYTDVGGQFRLTSLHSKTSISDRTLSVSMHDLSTTRYDSGVNTGVITGFDWCTYSIDDANKRTWCKEFKTPFHVMKGTGQTKHVSNIVLSTRYIPQIHTLQNTFTY